MQRRSTRFASGPSERLRAGLCAVAGVLAVGLLVLPSVRGQGEKTPAAKQPAAGESERAAKDGPLPPAIKSRVFSRILRGAEEGPVFFDVETGYSFTPPPDLVPAENRGRSIEKWVLSEPLKTWVRSQGIDFALQTDMRTHVAVVGFDVRTGEPIPAGGRRQNLRSDEGPLDPAFFIAAIKPPVFESVTWNFTKNYSQLVPFVTREGSPGLFTVAIYPSSVPATVQIACKLARDPNVVKLTGQPLLPVFEPPFFSFSKPGVLVVDVIDRKLRLRYLDSPQEILVGGGEVLVRGPAGTALRAARLTGGRLELDGVKEAVTFTLKGRSYPTALRRAGRHVQIEMIGRVAETVRLELKMPELKPLKVDSLAWQLAPVQAIDSGRANRLQDRQRRRAEAARWLAEMAKHGYALKPGESVGHVALPFPAARDEYWCAAHPNAFFPMSIQTGPTAADYRWDGKELHEHWVIGGRRGLLNLVDALHGIKSQEISGPADLLEKPLTGDWVARPDIPDEVFARDLEAVLRRDFRLPIHLEFRNEKRDVYVARGHFHSASGSVDIYGKRMYPGPRSAGGGFGDFNECLKWVGRWIDTPIVNEVTDAPREISWRLHAAFGPRPRGQRSREGQIGTDDDHDAALVLANIEHQTGVHFTKERRPVKMLVVEKKE
jgi:hypothetical protein